jgi:tRNA threonylcarbamoyladenosine biosynthesis protein TsaB
MTVLGIETATTVCAAAVVRDGSLASEHSLDAPQAHAEQLLTLVDKALRAARVELNDLDGFAVSIGPGSFTGLRIGLSTVKGLAFATGKPLVGVPTLMALAYQAVRSELVGEDEYIVPMIDARRDEVYMALYRRSGSTVEELRPSQAVRLRDLPALLPASGHLLLMGDGADKVSQSPLGLNVRFVVPPLRACSGASVALLGETALKAGEASDGAALEPLYVKEFYTTAHIQQKLRD